MKTMQIALSLLMCGVLAQAQPGTGGNKELSISGSYQNISNGGSSGSGAVLLSPRLGFFVYEGLELEPEILLLFASGNDPVYMANGNVSYNFVGVGKAVPFVLAGYGIANTVPTFGVPFLSTSFRISVLNVGAGVKAFLRENIALRMEYRFQRFTGGTVTMVSVYGYGYNTDFEVTMHTVQFGISVLL